MSKEAQKLLSFSRPLPAPFDKLSKKKVAATSKYGDGMQATLSCSVIKAIHAYCGCMTGAVDGALGRIDHRCVAEYKSSMNPGDYHLVIYDPTSGSFSASVYDKDIGTMGAYSVGTKTRDGSALLMAMLPELQQDEEFKDTLEEYLDDYVGGFTDLTAATRRMAILCDNVYRRIADDTNPVHIKASVDTSGNIMRVAQASLDSGAFTPCAVLAGEFTVFAQVAAPTKLTPETAMPHSDFVGQYVMTQARTLSPQEQSLVPSLEPWYILPAEVVSVCVHAKQSTSKSLPMRNFLLRGPAGTGKTEGAKAIAAGLGLPYMKYTCSANTEVYDFVGMVFPETEFQSTGDATLDAERKELLEMGGITYENVAKLLTLPALDDMDYDPEGVYLALTGTAKPDASSQDCMAIVLARVTEKVQQLSRVKNDEQKSGQTFTYVETDFIKALKHGYLVEIQEPSTIMQPGVLVGLNSLLEQGGTITLPTGEIIRRHPDTVVVVTTNIDYEGCRGMNQSVLDRMNLALDIELPPPEIMAQRAMAVTGCEDDTMVSQMVQVVNDMADYCRKNGIADGSCGMRGLIDWIMSAEITGDPHTSALFTVISKATANEEDREALITSVLEPMFSPKRRKTA